MLNQIPKSAVAGIGFPALGSDFASLQLAVQYQLESSQWMDREQMQALQFRQLGPLIRHAASTVPFYRELYSQHTIPKPLTAQFFQQLPVARRAAVQQAGDELLCSSLPQGHEVTGWETTSGSTGRPVRIAHTRPADLLWLAFAMRDHLWHQRNFTDKLGAIRWYERGTAEPPAGYTSKNWGYIVDPLFDSAPCVMLNIASPLEQQLEWLLREKPAYLISFPSNLLALARYVEQKGLALPAIRQIRTVGETLDSNTREYIQNVFNSRIADIYTCEEAGYLAIQCPAADHYHVQSENVLLEIVDEDGLPCEPGQPGEVLITSLNNFATPLIRYEVGDIAEFGEPCSCGRKLPVIRKILGRKRNRLILPTGESRFPYLGEYGSIHALTGQTPDQIQWIQHSTKEIEVKIVLQRPFTSEQAGKVARQMQHNFGHPFEIRFTYLDEIPKGANGKYEDFISLVQA